jgi:hypothetical protein
MTQTTMTGPQGSGRDRARPDTRLATGFLKPVALPALAAAVQAVRPQPRPTKPKSLPAFLLKETELG